MKVKVMKMKVIEIFKIYMCNLLRNHLYEKRNSVASSCHDYHFVSSISSSLLFLLHSVAHCK